MNLDSLNTAFDNAVTIIFYIVILLVTLALTYVFLYLLAIYLKIKKREEASLEMVTLEVKMPKENEIKIDAAEQMFSAFSSLTKHGFLAFLEPDEVIAFEIVGRQADIRFYVSASSHVKDLVEKQIYGYYPSADIRTVDEPNIFTEQGKVDFTALRTTGAIYQPLKTYKELTTDPLAGITSALSKMSEGEAGMLQILIRPAHHKWKHAGKHFIAHTKKEEANPEKASFKVDAKTLEKIDEKASKAGFDTAIRIVVTSSSKESAHSHLRNIKSAFTQFASDHNEFDDAKIFFKGAFMINFIYKFLPIMEPWFAKTISVLSSEELATIFHLPNKTIETPHINWLKAKTAPVSGEVPSKGGTYIGFGQYRGVKRDVCIGFEDRRRHMYIIGKTGTGKSELLQDMAIQDIKAGYGVCVIDPHGDLIENITPHIPASRAEDVIYFDPSDTDRPMGLNLLEAQTEEQKHFITGSIINLMYKLYDPQRTGIIGPRFEHTVRNAMLTVMTEPGNTFVEVMRILIDPKYVQELLPKVEDPMVRRFWTDQIAQTSDFHKSETLDYITSKFGRFVTNKTMRNIIGQSKSAFDFRKVMDEGKILLVNLSKGRLGEENSSFLGLVLIPKILVAAMSRQDMPQEDRKDFFLYVDEFQNFATPDFATILSEARKYRLNLTVANQFIGQMDEEVKNAVFGNVGTIASFRLGVTDASFLAHEFAPVFGESDLINIDRYNIYMRTIVNNDPVPPFSVDLYKDMEKLKASANPKIAQAIIQLSRLKYGKPRELIEAEIIQRSNL
ncbi:MAG TPA: DUF87 domain-containing protein [Candidatus Nitrosocosmicus sp.]|nr:DUF87 domain-containing protein [Candidatus Nitrosocosmicus sp.]